MLNENIYKRDKENYLINELNSNSDNFSLKKKLFNKLIWSSRRS